MLFIEGFKFPADEWAEKIQEQVKQTNKLMEHYEMICEEKKVWIILLVMLKLI